MTAATAHSTPDALAETLAHGMAALGVPATAAQHAQLLAYLDLLVKWNKTYNLTAIRERERMVTHHLLDALAVLPQLPQKESLRVLDVGSGGGIPGLPFAIVRPDWHVTLVDANHKKVAFVTQATIELRLRNVDAHAARVEDLQPAAPYDIVISRAFADLATFAAAAARHLAPGGALVAMKGVHPDEELAELPREFAVTEKTSLAVPGLDAARHLIVMRRAHEVATDAITAAAAR
ncbi:MAG: 16S rRNA (guanine(527)-N(7))-methyltransferase RsmG [Casimicrobiaceae bacterium]